MQRWTPRRFNMEVYVGCYFVRQQKTNKEQGLGTDQMIKRPAPNPCSLGFFYFLFLSLKHMQSATKVIQGRSTNKSEEKSYRHAMMDTHCIQADRWIEMKKDSWK